MKSTPRRVFFLKPSNKEDYIEPSVNSLVVLQDGQTLMMADGENNRHIKVLDMRRPDVIYVVRTLVEVPLRMALLPDGLVSVTTREPVIYLLKVTAVEVSQMLRFKTELCYYGVGGLEDDTLEVSCSVTGRDGSSVATRVDVINRSGEVVRIVNGGERLLTCLKLPSHLYVADNTVFLSLDASNAVSRLSLATGELLDTLQHSDLKNPRQVVVDGAGFVYVASYGGKCVLVRSPAGQWRKLVTAEDNSDKECEAPRGLCVTASGRLVVAWRSKEGPAVVSDYDL
jgi:DNA-binding beta-propeller fold protein YncE